MKLNEPTPIVCGTDFSENAAQASTAAAVLAARSGKPLLLVHVADEFNGLGDDQKKLTAFLRPVAKKLRAEAYRLKKAGATVETKVLTGQLAERAIRELVEKHPAALVVVSSVSKTAFDRWTLGTTSESIAQSVASPTLVVRSSAPFEAWARGERPLKIFVAVDSASVSEAALQWVRDLRGLGPCDIVVAHVNRPTEEASRLGVSAPVGLGGNLPEMQSMLERDLQGKVTRVLGEDDVRVWVRGNSGRADYPLVEMAMESQADVIVVGTHQWHGLSRLQHGSVSRGILHHAPMSVACVPTPAAAPMAEPRIRACQRVLVAVDLNEPHGFAAPYGYSIVNPGGTVRLLHNIVPSFLLSNPTKEEHAQIVAESEAKLRALAPDKADAPDITTEVEVTESRETAEAICAAAERFGADIVCIGSHTRPGFTAKVLGSVALAVLQTSRRPVLVVWPPAK